jgi:exonuclease III
LTSYNCKNIKTGGTSISEILKDNDIILIQEHWLFHSQTSIISDINSDINFVAKGVDINDPLLLVSLPRGYGGVAIVWKKNIDHLVRTLSDGSEKIQCIELESAKRNVIIICVYMPANGSKNHQVEY